MVGVHWPSVVVLVPGSHGVEIVLDVVVVGMLGLMPTVVML